MQTTALLPPAAATWCGTVLLAHLAIGLTTLQCPTVVTSLRQLHSEALHNHYQHMGGWMAITKSLHVIR